MIIQDLQNKQLIHPPSWLSNNVHYLTMMGSVAYGVESATSDRDVYGFCIPPKELVFPHLTGEIFGFGRQTQRFEQYQEHHIKDHPIEWDLSIYNIVKYFQLCMENNPNMIDSLFVPNFCILHCTKVGQIARENRKLFLHKGSWHKFKGYAYSQMHKIKSKNKEGKRKDIIEQYGYDIKFAYHVVRLLNEVEQILTEGDLDLIRNREQLKSIRRGEWTEEEIYSYFSKKEYALEKLYTESTLQHSPDEVAIKQLLVNCLEEHYGSLDKAIHTPDKYENIVREIQKIINNI